MKKIAFLVCRNGLGHIRRVLAILNSLLRERKNFNAKVFSSKEKIELLKDWSIYKKIIKNEKVKFIPFEPYPFWSENLEKIDLKKLLSWEKDLKKLNLEKFDLLISDNLVETLKYNKRTILSGSFLWHIVYLNAFGKKKEIQDYYDKCEEILLKNKPKMIVNKYFYMPELERDTDLYKVGMLKSIKKSLKKSEEKKIGVFISFSAEGSLLEKIGEVNYQRFENFKIYLDKRFKREIKRKPIFDYNKIGFSKIKAILGVASMGVITESFGTSTPLFFFPSKNPEIEHNSKVLKNLSLGYEVTSFEDGFEKIYSFYKKNSNYKYYLKRLKKIDKEGLKETVNFLKKFI